MQGDRDDRVRREMFTLRRRKNREWEVRRRRIMRG